MQREGTIHAITQIGHVLDRSNSMWNRQHVCSGHCIILHQMQHKEAAEVGTQQHSSTSCVKRVTGHLWHRQTQSSQTVSAASEPKEINLFSHAYSVSFTIFSETIHVVFWAFFCLFLSMTELGLIKKQQQFVSSKQQAASSHWTSVIRWLRSHCTQVWKHQSLGNSCQISEGQESRTRVSCLFRASS